MVVVEMLLFAVAHYFTFSHKPYVDPAAAEVPCITACLRMLDVRDVAGDIKEHFVDPIPRPKFRIRRNTQGCHSGEDSPLLRSRSESLLPLPRTPTPSLEGVEAKAAAENCRGPSSDTDITVASGKQTSVKQQQQLSELSYDTLLYSELDSRTEYGLRERMIASAADKMEERTESTTGSSSSEESLQVHQI